MDVVRLDMNAYLLLQLVSGAVLAIALGVPFAPTELDCTGAVEYGDAHLVISSCGGAYKRDPTDVNAGAALARALLRIDDLRGAEQTARQLLTTPAIADAEQILAYVAMRDQQPARAIELLSDARRKHVDANLWTEVARDDQTLAGAYEHQDRIAEALAAIASCIDDAHRATAIASEGYGHFLAARLLTHIGHFEAAVREFEVARTMLDRDADLAWLYLERAAMYQYRSFDTFHRDYNKLAVADQERALAAARKAQLLPQESKAQANLVYSLAEIGKVDEARRALAAARALDVKHHSDAILQMLAARIEYRAGNAKRAIELAVPVAGKLEDTDQEIIATTMLARIGLDTGDLDLAIQWARRGVELVNNKRAELPLAMRAYVMTTRRGPYELLFTALARAGKTDEAIVAFDHWYGRTLRDASREHARPVGTLTDAIAQAKQLEAQPDDAPPPLSSARDLFAQLADVDLVALVVAEARVWRIEAYHGERSLTDLGPTAELENKLPQFLAKPTTRELGIELGTRLFGDRAFHHSEVTLHVVLDDRLAKLPVAALRGSDGLPLVASRAFVRPPRLSDLGCVPALSPQASIAFIADPAGDRVSIRATAETLARRHGTAAIVGRDATRAALTKALETSDIVHVVSHGDIDRFGGRLEMSDGEMPASDLLTLRAAPAFVLVSACSSGASDDPEAASSVAASLLAAGSKQILATVRPVDEAGAADVIERFDREMSDPVRGLAHVQAALANTGNTDWPNFTVFGHDTCRKELKSHAQ